MASSDSYLNDYGDIFVATSGHHGSDIASQRLDELDRTCLLQLLSQGKQVHILDFGCGFGAFGLRCGLLGAKVMLNDLVEPPKIAQCLEGLRGCFAKVEIKFMNGDIRNVAKQMHQFEIIYSQRMLHYIPYQDAVNVLQSLAKATTGPQKYYLSMSGLKSNLRVGYDASTKDIVGRFDHLSKDIQAQHGIFEPVCLYTDADAARLAADARLSVERIWLSDFGNVKCIFAKP
jgi:SAM-dependent methyltransferase